MPRKSEAEISPLERLRRFFGCRQASYLACLWRCIFEFLLCLWVTRVPFVIVLIGFLILDFTPQAQDLLIPLVDFHGLSGLLRIGAYFVLHFVFWAALVHYSARLLINDDERLHVYRREHPSRYFGWLERWVPRLLGLSTFAAVMISADRARVNLPVLPENDEGVILSITHSLYWFMFLCALAAILFFYYVVYRAALAKKAKLDRISDAAAVAYPLLNFADIGKEKSAEKFRGDATAQDKIGRLLLLFVFIVFAFVLLAGPLQIAEIFPRAFAVSLLLGGWVPVLTYLSAIGRRLRAPLIGAMFAGFAIVAAIVGDNHDVRLIDNTGTKPRAPNVEKPKLRLERAVQMWMEANGCKEKGKEGRPQDCPRPIVVAAAGGASRAGFFTASVIGEYIDRAGQHGLDAGRVRDRLFAISSISGSSVGAVMTVTALAAAGKAARFPCPSAPFSLWYGDEIKNWRGCLESLMSGDFLTPTFIGLGFHDMIPLRLWPDRAAMIEQSWERIFADAMKNGVGGGKDLPCPAELTCPFWSLQPDADFWLPLLVLNGVSVGTGDRVLTTLLDSTYRAKSKCPAGTQTEECPLFAETWFFHDLLNQKVQSLGWRAEVQRFLKRLSPFDGNHPNDVSLSTAAHNSARFVAVSPPGTIRNQEYYAVDRIVDGGYFENYGVLTALELAAGIRAAEPGLVPFVLVLSNSPADPHDPPVLRELPNNVKDTDFLTDITSFLASVFHTRDARATFAVDQLRDISLAQAPGDCKASFAHIRVWPERVNSKSKMCEGNFSKNPRAISLSWWLSTPLQYRLFEEIEGPETCNRDEMAKVWAALTMKSGCAGAGR